MLESKPLWDTASVKLAVKLQFLFPVLEAEFKMRQTATEALGSLLLGDSWGHERQHISDTESKSTGAATKSTAHEVILYNRGHRNDDVCAILTETCKAVAAVATKMFVGYAKILVMEPGTQLLAQTGTTNWRLRVHLPLAQSGVGAALSLQGEKTWYPKGKAIVYDDSYEHDITNDGKDPLVILVVDIWHPALTQADLLLKYNEETFYQRQAIQPKEPQGVADTYSNHMVEAERNFQSAAKYQ
jgi:hypothetical protein